MRRLISDGVVVDKSVYVARHSWRVAQLLGTDGSAAFDSFSARWRAHPDRRRLPHMAVRHSRKHR